MYRYASVKHAYGTWDDVMPQLDTCTPEKHPLDSSQSTVGLCTLNQVDT
jgi:hypothetical protein